jgi:hypothetical protein
MRLSLDGARALGPFVRAFRQKFTVGNGPLPYLSGSAMHRINELCVDP